MMASFRQQDVQNPHFRLPLQFGGINGGALVNEQDTSEDIIDCIKAIISFPIGTRHDMPEFGIPDLLFRQQSAIVMQQLRDAVAEWEVRPTVDVSGGPLLSDQMILDILIKAGVREDG
jgi:phage baseplate assembly protein W